MFSLACPHDTLKAIANSNCFRYVQKLSQLDLDFIPIESSVFTFDCIETSLVYNLRSNLAPNRMKQMEQLAEQLATVCVTLGEYPKICIRKTESNLELAQLTQTKMDAALESNPGMGQGLHKDRSILLILDRGFDPLSPLLHELTLQAMCYDLLEVVGDMCTYDQDRRMTLTSEDALWKELRHSHIADVTRTLPLRLREFAASKKEFSGTPPSSKSVERDGGYVNEGSELSDSTRQEPMKLRDLSNLIKRMPEYQTEAASYTAAFKIAEKCMAIFRKGVDKLCCLEQDLVMGQTAQGNPLRDPMRLLSELFKYDFTSIENKLRMLMIFVLIKDGILERHLEKLLLTAKVEPLNKVLFASLSLVVGAQLIQPEPSVVTHRQPAESTVRFDQIESLQRLPAICKVTDKVQRYLPSQGKRKDRVDSSSYAFSRWTPYLMDILEEAIQDKLSPAHFTFMSKRGMGGNQGSAASMNSPSSGFQGPSARFRPGGNTGSSNIGTSTGSFNGRAASPMTGAKAEHCGPRLIVCVVGGATWSEARTAYQVTQKCIETRLAESDRQTGGRQERTSAASVPGGGGIGWNWEVIIGGTHMLTPTSFLDDLNSIYRHLVADVSTGFQST